MYILYFQTYYGIDFEHIKDPLEREALKTMIKTYGQTPKQLFIRKHPQRQVANLRNKNPEKNKKNKDPVSLADRSALNSRRVSKICPNKFEIYNDKI